MSPESIRPPGGLRVPLNGPGACANVLGRSGAQCYLRDGTRVCIRSICAPDAQACTAMLHACSPKSLYSRYERLVSESLDELATLLCCPDPQCEMTVVAQVARGSSFTIVGVAQLIADPHLDTAEYAVLVADPWQNKGLGSALTDVCLRLSHARGIRRVVAEFLPSNMRIIQIFESRQFELRRDFQGHVVSSQKIISTENGKRLAEMVTPTP